MKTKEEKGRKDIKNTKNSFIRSDLNKPNFFKNNWVQLVLISLAIVVIIALAYMALSPYLNKKSLEKDIANSQITSSASINKITCYSSAFGFNNTNNKVQNGWSVDLSQYTDIAIYLNTQDANISSMYIDNISFSNNNFSHLGLSYLMPENFGKSPLLGEDSASQEETTDENKVNSSNTNTLLSNVSVPERIDLPLSNPITLRYMNYNLKENCLITDIKDPLVFDGSILKRGKVTLSSLKNTVSFTLHFVNSNGNTSALPVTINIPFENKQSGKRIYDGDYLEEF